MFVVCSAVGLVVGFALFGALTYLPLFQQVVRGLSPTASGLQLLPVMGGLLVSSIVSGQIIARTGRYKVFPIAGTAVAALGMCLLSSLDESTGSGVAALHMLVLGLGLGMVMQVLVLATQNAVSYEQLGVATSGATLFRSIGGSLGTAMLGAIFSARLTSRAAGRRGTSGGIDPAPIERLPALHPTLHRVVHRRAHSSFPVARSSARRLPADLADPGAAAAHDGRDVVGESLGAPVDTDSLRELTRALTRLSAASARWRSWPSGGARGHRALAGRRVAAAARGRARRAVARAPRAAAGPTEHASTRARGAPRGTAARRRAADRRGPCTARPAGRRAHRRAARLIADWEPDQNPELDPLLRRLAGSCRARAAQG